MSAETAQRHVPRGDGDAADRVDEAVATVSARPTARRGTFALGSVRATVAPGSVGAAVMPAWVATDAPPERTRRTHAVTPGGIAWELPDLRGASRASVLRGASALCLMAVYASALSFLPRGRAEPPATPAAPLVLTEQEIDLAPPPPEPEPEPEPEVAPEPSPVAAPTARAAATPAPSAPAPSEPSGSPPPPAQAASVVAAEAPSAPVDFTGFDMTTGAAERYAGGITASSGTNTRAVHAAAVDPNARPDGAQGAASQARPVRLARNPRCAWPAEAHALGINAQTVVLRAVVGADGRAVSVDVLGDPGHGFGAAALSCAQSAHFEAALDASGQPYLATSPPIRVRFTR